MACQKINVKSFDFETTNNLGKCPVVVEVKQMNNSVLWQEYVISNRCLILIVKSKFKKENVN